MKSKINFSLVLMLALPLFYACDPYFGNKECQEEQTINQTMTIYPYRDTYALGDTIWIETKFELPANSPILNDSIYLGIPFKLIIVYLSNNPWQYAFFNYFSIGACEGKFNFSQFSSIEHGPDAGRLLLSYIHSGNTVKNKIYLVCKKAGIFQIGQPSLTDLNIINKNMSCNQELNIYTMTERGKDNFNYLLKYSIDTTYVKLDSASTYKEGLFTFIVR